MTDGDALRTAAERVLTPLVTPALWRDVDAGVFPSAAWDAAEAAGLTAALRPEAAGGFGAAVPDALSVLLAAGAQAWPLPLADTMLAGWVLGRAGLTVPDGPLGLVADVGGVAWDVPWGRALAGLVVVAADRVTLLPPGAWITEHGTNVANEPRDTLRFATEDGVPSPVRADQLHAAGAVTRTLLIAGALERITRDTVAYAQARTQFGKAIGRQQAVQQSLAVLAGQAAAARAAADMAAEAFEAVDLPPIAAAKTRAGEAAGIGAAIAHQVHGAIGFTAEHPLHRLTRRLWAWRDEHGTEAEWSLLLGRHLAAAGADRLWATVSAL